MIHARAASCRKLARTLLLLIVVFTGCNLKSLDEQLIEECGSPSGDIVKVKELLAKGAKVDSTNDTGKTALMQAAWMGRVEILKTLLGAGADVRHTDKYSYTALMDAVQGALLWTRDSKPTFDQSNYEGTLKLLIASGVNVNATNHVGATALQMAVDKSVSGQAGDPLVVTTLVKILLEGGADAETDKSISSKLDVKPSVLFAAAMNGQTGAIQALLDRHKENIESRNISGETAFMLSVRYEHMDTARLLAAMGADVSAQDENGQTALMIVSEKNDLSSVESLLELKADANKKDREGRTALARAVAKGQIESIKLLLTHGADPNLADSHGMTPLKSAVWSNRTDVVDLLKSYEAKQ